jgi:hypothetical protein
LQQGGRTESGESDDEQASWPDRSWIDVSTAADGRGGFVVGLF